jgi:hypothetical protein
MPRLGKHEFGSVLGYSATFKRKKWLYLTSDQLKTVIGTSKTARQLKGELAADGLLDRGSTRKHLVQRRIFSDAKGNKGHKRVHAFRAKILNEQNLS